MRDPARADGYDELEYYQDEPANPAPRYEFDGIRVGQAPNGDLATSDAERMVLHYFAVRDAELEIIGFAPTPPVLPQPSALRVKVEALAQDWPACDLGEHAWPLSEPFCVKHHQDGRETVYRLQAQEVPHAR